MQSHALWRLWLVESGLEAQLSGCDEVTAGEVQGNMWHVATALSSRLLVTSGNSSCHKIYYNCVRSGNTEFSFRNMTLGALGVMAGGLGLFRCWNHATGLLTHLLPFYVLQRIAILGRIWLYPLGIDSSVRYKWALHMKMEPGGWRGAVGNEKRS